MPWFIQLIMAIFMIILYIAIFMGLYTSSNYSDKRLFYSFGIGTYSTLLLLFWIYQTNATNLGDTYIVANIIGQIDKKWKQWNRVILVTP